MLSIQGSSRLRDILIAVVVSLIFSQIGFLVLLLTVPLYTLYYRKGSRDLLISTASVALLLIVMSVWKTRSVADTELRRALVIIEVLIPMLLMLGMFFVIDIIPVISGFRKLYRFFLATAAAVLVFIPVYNILMQNDVLTEAISSQMDAVAGAFFGDGSGTYDGEVFKSYLGNEGLSGYMKNFYMKSAAAIFFLILLISSRASEMILFRMRGRKVQQLSDFKVPDVLLWPVMLAAVGMLVDIFGLLNLGYATAVVWNAGIILLFVYGLQGLAILRAVFARFKVPNALRMSVELLLIMMIVIPGINYIVIIGLPVLGISETWINLRKSIRST